MTWRASPISPWVEGSSFLFDSQITVRPHALQISVGATRPSDLVSGLTKILFDKITRLQDTTGMIVSHTPVVSNTD